MSRYKKKGAALVLLLITVAVIALAVIFLLTLVSKTGIISVIKNDVDYYIVQEDKGRSLLSFINSREDSPMNYLTLLGASASSDFKDQNTIKTTLNKIKEFEKIGGCSVNIIFRNQKVSFESLGSQSASSPARSFSSFGCVISEKENPEIELKNFPVVGDTCITSSYGWRKLPGNDFHSGVDFGVRQSKFNDIVATQDGIVIDVYSNCKDSSYTNLDSSERNLWDKCYTPEELNELNKQERNCGNKFGSEWRDCYKQSPCLCNGGMGNMVVLGHKFDQNNPEFDYYTVYYHMAENSIPSRIKKGEYVTAGTLLGIIGNTGRSTAAHLHFGIMKEYTGLYGADENYYDPCPYLAELDEYQRMKNIGNCMACCDAPCTDITLKSNEDSKIEQCNDKGYEIMEGMTIPMPRGEVGSLQMIKW